MDPTGNSSAYFTEAEPDPVVPTKTNPEVLMPEGEGSFISLSSSEQALMNSTKSSRLRCITQFSVFFLLKFDAAKFCIVAGWLLIHRKAAIFLIILLGVEIRCFQEGFTCVNMVLYLKRVINFKLIVNARAWDPEVIEDFSVKNILQIEG